MSLKHVIRNCREIDESNVSKACIPTGFEMIGSCRKKEWYIVYCDGIWNDLKLQIQMKTSTVNGALGQYF